MSFKSTWIDSLVDATQEINLRHAQHPILSREDLFQRVLHATDETGLPRQVIYCSESKTFCARGYFAMLCDPHLLEAPPADESRIRIVKEPPRFKPNSFLYRDAKTGSFQYCINADCHERITQESFSINPFVFDKTALKKFMVALKRYGLRDGPGPHFPSTFFPEKAEINWSIKYQQGLIPPVYASDA